MEPLSLGAGALGALETITGGAGGPSGAWGGTHHSGQWQLGGLTVNNGLPQWVWIAALAVGAFYVYKRHA
ncbi:hypothetical protein O1O06_11860 [Grimontia hollisae]|uniref:hypothetical protein n=1 Tax=Grimontia hollisae TaxID=673 RepID=UPI0023DC96F4|nr:hypothetical protein [Grimontia hollisae]MDF2185458.1 hypothetical protein [Grimontia hollisae]